MVSSLKRPMHQKSHKKKNWPGQDGTKSTKKIVVNGSELPLSIPPTQVRRTQKPMNHALLMWLHFMVKAVGTDESSNESIEITQIMTRQTSQLQKQGIDQAQQTRYWCNPLTLSKNTYLARGTKPRFDTCKFTICKHLQSRNSRGAVL